MKKHESALWAHGGCEKCRYLGTYDGCDLYYCDAIPNRPGVLARYGAGEFEFKAMIIPSSAPSDIHLLEAYLRSSEYRARGKEPKALIHCCPVADEGGPHG